MMPLMCVGCAHFNPIWLVDDRTMINQNIPCACALECEKAFQSNFRGHTEEKDEYVARKGKDE